jgi:hypothetical protein
MAWTPWEAQVRLHTVMNLHPDLHPAGARLRVTRTGR